MSFHSTLKSIFESVHRIFDQRWNWSRDVFSNLGEGFSPLSGDVDHCLLHDFPNWWYYKSSYGFLKHFFLVSFKLIFFDFSFHVPISKLSAMPEWVKPDSFQTSVPSTKLLIGNIAWNITNWSIFSTHPGSMKSKE